MAEARDEMSRPRSTRLGVEQVRAIDHFAESLFVMFPHMLGVTHVGSSRTRDDWRDVDLRIVMPDERMDALRSVLDVLDLNMLLSRWGQQVTGLPIDCQVQEQSEHQRLGYDIAGRPQHNWRGAGRLGVFARSTRDTDPRTRTCRPSWRHLPGLRGR